VAGGSSPILPAGAIRLGGDEHVPTLVNLFKDPDKSVRAAVIQLLGERRDPRIVPSLAEALKSGLSKSLIAI
jgi:HEAT repeat protein